MTNQDRIPWLTLDYNIYNETKNDICYGCAATYTVMNLLSKNEPIDPDIFNDRDRYATYLDCEINDLHNFEIAIDNLRRGYVKTLSKYFETQLPDPDPDGNWYLSNELPINGLLLIKKYYDRLIADRVKV